MLNSLLKQATRNIKKWSYAFPVLVCLVSVLVLPSCEDSGTRILYSGSKVGDQICASYELFTGKDEKTIMVEKGDTISFSYVSSVEQGNLKMEIYNPDDVLITSFTTNKTGTKQLDIEKTGTHTVLITGNQTKGRYQVSWKIIN